MQKLGFIVFLLFHILLLPTIPRFVSYFFIIFYNDNFYLLFVWLLFLYILKIIFLPVLYTIFNKIHIVNYLSNKLKNNKIAFVTLFLTFIIDILFIVNICKYTNTTLQEYIKNILITCFICGGGLSLSYLAMILWLKVKKFNVPKIVTILSIITAIFQFIYFIYTKGGFYKISLLFFLPAIFVFAINYPFKKEENPSAFEKILIGILNFIIVILVQIFFMTGILFI